MQRHHFTTLVAIAAALTLPFAGPAAADSSGKGKSGKHKQAKVCKQGKGFEAKGVLGAGSTLEQVAGAETARRSDDRWTGTLVVKVQKGNKRGRADRGVRSYELVSARVRGAGDGVPVAGTRVSLVGKRFGSKCAAAGVTVEKVAFKAAKSPRDEEEADDDRNDDVEPEHEESDDDSADDDDGEGRDDDERDEDEEADDELFAGSRR